LQKKCVINVLRTAFTPVAPKSIRIQSRCQYHFTLLGSTGAKAARRALMKLPLGLVVKKIWINWHFKLLLFVYVNDNSKCEVSGSDSIYLIKKCKTKLEFSQETPLGVNFIINIVLEAFSAQRSQKCKKILTTWLNFYAFGIRVHKSCA